jgi:hypothetical protein
MRARTRFSQLLNFRIFQQHQRIAAIQRTAQTANRSVTKVTASTYNQCQVGGAGGKEEGRISFQGSDVTPH